MRKVIHLGHHIWFVIHLDAVGNIETVEDHDWREGGVVNPRPGETHAQLFERSFRARWSGPESQKQELFAKAQAFLKTAEEHINLVDD